MILLLVIILIVLAIGGFGYRSYGDRVNPLGGLLGLVLVLVLIFLVGRYLLGLW